MKKLIVLFSLFVLNNAFSQFEHCQDLTGIWKAKSCTRSSGEMMYPFEFPYSVIGISQEQCEKISFAIVKKGAKPGQIAEFFLKYSKAINKRGFSSGNKGNLLFFTITPRVLESGRFDEPMEYSEGLGKKAIVSSSWISYSEGQQPDQLAVQVEFIRFNRYDYDNPINLLIEAPNKDSNPNEMKVTIKDDKSLMSCQYEQPYTQ